MNNNIINTNAGFETIEDSEYENLLKQRDFSMNIGKIEEISVSPIKKSQGGFATGFVLGISAGVAFVLCVVVLYLLGIINL